MAARCKGVIPFMSLASIKAPCLTNIISMGSRPIRVRVMMLNNITMHCRIMQRNLVLIISLVDVLAHQKLFLESVQAVGDYQVENGDTLILVLFRLYRFHDLKNLILLLQSL